MKNVLMNINDKILIRKRAVIETVNDELKNIAQIEHSRHRSSIISWPMHFQLLLPIASLIRNPPLKWNLSMTGNLRCFKLYRTHVNLGLSYTYHFWYLYPFPSLKGMSFQRIRSRLPFYKYIVKNLMSIFSFLCHQNGIGSMYSKENP